MWPLSLRVGGVLVAGPLKNTFFAASLMQYAIRILCGGKIARKGKGEEALSFLNSYRVLSFQYILSKRKPLLIVDRLY